MVHNIQNKSKLISTYFTEIIEEIKFEEFLINKELKY